MAEGIVSSVELIIGSSGKISYLGLHHGDDIAEFEEKILSMIRFGEKEGTVVFTDLFGGTPNNVIAKIIHEYPNEKIKAFTGVNLPLVLEAVTSKDQMEFDELVQKLKESILNQPFDIEERLNLR